jgi:ketosteroid isomerase-like protein
MTEEHVEIVRRQYAAFAARDWAELADVCHPNIEYETLESAPGVRGCYRGLHEITEFFDSWSDPYTEFRVEADEIVDAGDRVVTVERHLARGLKGSAAESWIQTSFACVISFKGGKIWRVKEYPSRADALEAAGIGD